MIHTRLAQARLLRLLLQFPAVYIQGPRQAGKSTLARSALPGFTFFDLEDPRDFDRLQADPLFELAMARRVVIDEAQRMPALFPILRSELDRDPRRRVVLLGSASPALSSEVSESLAGRCAFLELGGISLLEHPGERLWLEGAFPRVHWGRPRARPKEWYPAYLQAVLERDIPQLGFRVAAARLRNLLTMIAHGQGGICNLSELGGSLGVNYHAVAHIIDIFEGIFLVRRLPPYFANIGKRLVKSPKLYVRDTGLLHSLLGISFTKASLFAHPKAGASFETFCIEQLLTLATLADPDARAFFFRTHAGVEVDLLLSLRKRLIPIEIKLGLAVPDAHALRTVMLDLGLKRGYVIYPGRDTYELPGGIRVLPLDSLVGELRLGAPGPQ